MDAAKTIELTSDVIAEFAKAESAVKFAERVSGEVAIPAINQLRYALCHFIENDAAAAKRHCIRARYDAYEAAIGYFLEYVRNFFEQKIPPVELDRFLPKWRDYRLVFLRGRERLCSIRKLRDEDSSVFEAVESVIGEMIVVRDQIDAAFAEIQSVISQQKEAERKDIERERQDIEDAKAREDRRRYVISLAWSIGGFVVGVLGSIVGIIGLMLTIKNI